MKKHLIAAAVAAAVVAPAFAQSSVEIYGILDVSYGQDQVKNGPTATNRVKGTGLADSRMSSTRLGFKGTEDLGNGLTAGFVLEAGLNITGNDKTSAGKSPITTNGADVFNAATRQAFLTVGSKTAGSLLFGYKKQLETDFHDKFMIASENIAGGKFYTDGRQTRGDQVAYTLPTMGMVSASIAYSPASSEYQDTGTQNQYKIDASILSANVDIKAADNLVIGLHVGRGTVELGTAGVPSSSSFVAGKNDYDTQGIGVNYTINGLRLAAMYGERDVGTTGANLDKAEYMVLGASYPIGAVTLKGTYGSSEVKTGAGTETIDRTGYQLSADYNLSKRTKGYLVYGKDKDKKSSDLENSVVAVGVVHSF